MRQQHYIIKTPIKGVDTQPGQTIALDPQDTDTQALLACQAIALADHDEAGQTTEDDVTQGTGRPDDAEKLQQIITQAIEQMLIDDPDKANDKFWRKDGKPDVKALEQRLGFDISASARNTAWIQMTKTG